MTERVVLAYSGGLDTAVAARTLRDERGLDVVAGFVDLGQPFDRAAIEARATAAEAELRFVDARSAFAEGFCLPALHANALYEGKYPLVSALARPLIAAEVVRLARETGARFVAHGCTGKGNDQVRFETAFATLAPDLQIIAPVRDAALPRAESLSRAIAFGIPVSSEARTFSVDENLWGRTAECGPLEDPWAEPPAEAFGLTVDPRSAPNDPEEMTLSFRAGRPVAIDGVEMALPQLIAAVTEVAGRNGFGRVDMLENRLVGIKSRELYEVPGALALYAAHSDLEDLTLERDLAHEKSGLERRWAELCYYGQWYGPLHSGLRAFMAETQPHVTGDVRLRFFRGSCTVVGRRSPMALYDEGLATYDGNRDRFDHSNAAGFVALWSLPLRVWGERESGTKPLQPEARPPEPPQQPEPQPMRPASAASPHAAATPPRPMWAGRFPGPPSDELIAFTSSLSFDGALIEHDLRATAAHVGALFAAGLLEEAERSALASTLDELLTAAKAGAFSFDPADEDVHSAVERVVTQRLGPTGARVHAGRSRNDLVAADLRLWTKDAARDLASSARALASALGDRAGEHLGSVMPGYTHMQRAQPVTLGHHLLAHAFALVRDAERFGAAARSADVSPLGAGAVAGSTLGLDNAGTAATLGFSRTFDNSIDAVSDRDFALDFLCACVTAAIHVSRLAEDVVLWSTTEFGFARVSDAYATGSSMMPQKRNPDVAELARAKCGRVLGDLVRLATVMKGLPLAYDRDLQEDKEAVFDARDAVAGSLDAMRGLVQTLVFDTERMRLACAGGGLLATDVAEQLVSKGMPFREAHERVAGLVARLESDGRELGDAEPDDWASAGMQAPDSLDPADSIALRDFKGGPAPAAVARQLETLRSALAGGTEPGSPYNQPRRDARADEGARLESV